MKASAVAAQQPPANSSREQPRSDILCVMLETYQMVSNYLWNVLVMIAIFGVVDDQQDDSDHQQSKYNKGCYAQAVLPLFGLLPGTLVGLY